MIDFSNLPIKNKTYAGANGNKISVIFDGEQYMLKFPAPTNRSEFMSYKNSSVSEYLGCHIFDSVGIPTQKTVLGTYTKNGKEKLVVACKDFTSPGIVLQDFASLKNTIIDSEHNGYGTELSDILDSIENQMALNVNELKTRFWDMFIIDALIGNWDRHNGNWGFLYNQNDDTIKLAPVFDCGSSFFPQADEKIMFDSLNNSAELDFRVFSIPLSAIKVENKKINYFDFISSLENIDCNKSLLKITKLIDIEKINSIIEQTPYITDLQKQFYKAVIKARKERILDFSVSKLLKNFDKNGTDSVFYTQLSEADIKALEEAGVNVEVGTKTGDNINVRLLLTEKEKAETVLNEPPMTL